MTTTTDINKVTIALVAETGSTLSAGDYLDRLPLSASSASEPSLRGFARTVIGRLDPTASTSWVAFADAVTLIDYLLFGRPPKSHPSAPVVARVALDVSVEEAAAHGGSARPKGARIDEKELARAVAERASGKDLDSKVRAIVADALAKAPAGSSEDLTALKARVDSLQGDVLEAVDTAKAVADEAAKKAAEAARRVAEAATTAAAATVAGGSVSPDEVRRLIESTVRSVVAVTPELPRAATAASTADAPVNSEPDHGAKEVESKPFVSSDEDHVLQHLELFCAPGRSCKPVLVKGEAGAGKTFSARIHGRGFERAYEIGLNAQTEAADLLGFPRVDGGWQDGPLSAAFRSAAAGFTTQLRLDEFYRPQNSARSVLLTCTSPITDLKGKQFYPLTTGRAIPHPTEEGVFDQETLYAPVHLLAIVATTNVGSQYDVTIGDPAERRRFAPVHTDVTPELLRRVLGGALDKNKALKKSCGDLHERCISFWSAAKELARAGNIEVQPTLSTFCEAIEHPSATSKTGFLRVLTALGLHVWCGETLDGAPIPEQEKALRELLTRSFGR